LLAGIVILIILLASAGVFSVKYPQNCQHSAPSTKGTQGQTQEEMCFEERAVTDPVAVFTFFLVLIGGAQLALFYWQLGLIRDGMEDTKIAATAALRSAIATEKSVDTASKASELNREMGQAQVRAYLHVTNPSIIVARINDKTTNFELVIKASVFNFGNSPAVDVRLRQELAFHANYPYLQEVAGDEIFFRSSKSANIAPRTGDEFIFRHQQINGSVFSAEQADMFFKGVSGIVITVFVRFTDVFKTQIDNSFTFQAFVPGAQPGSEYVTIPMTGSAREIAAAQKTSQDYHAAQKKQK
jgi:hypothetical protein